ncbi:MAG TPA: acyltransferase domain-containing protein [Pseudonocardia sp.]|jgi:hypothetical protein
MSTPIERELIDALNFLAVPADEREELLASAPGNPADRLAVRRAADAVAEALRSAEPRLPGPPVGYRAPAHYFYAHVCLALLPEARRFHHLLGIPEEISRHSFQAFSDNLRRHRRIHRRGGLDGPEWVLRVFHGAVYRLGRLNFERATLGDTLASVTGGAADNPAIGVHIPSGGPLLRTQCLDSLSAAAEFFPRHFPHEPVSIAHCRSWLMDVQLADYLCAESNIVSFLRLFTTCDDPQPGDEAIVWWVFQVPDPQNWRSLQPRTRLQHAVLEHLHAGRHWRVDLGWRSLA